MANWIYRVSDNEFLYGGPCEVTPLAQESVISLSRNPNPRMERYDGAGGIRTATAQEIAAYDAARLISQSLGQFDDQKMLKASVLWIAAKLAVTPATAKTEILTIYRGL